MRIPGTSFHSDTTSAPRARASSVAVRSEPPRPSVATLPSAARPMKPGTIGTRRAARCGRSTLCRQAGGRADERTGAAVLAIGDHDLRRLDVDGPAAGAGDGGGQQRGRQPLAPGDDDIAGARREVLQDGDRRQELFELADRRLDGGQRGAAGRAGRQHRRRDAPMALAQGGDRAGRGLGPAGHGVIGGVEQQVGDAGQRRGDDDQRSADSRRCGAPRWRPRWRRPATRHRTSRRAGERTADGAARIGRARTGASSAHILSWPRPTRRIRPGRLLAGQRIGARSWKCAASGLVPLPPSMSHGVRSPLAAHRPLPFQPAFGSSMRPSKPLA